MDFSLCCWLLVSVSDAKEYGSKKELNDVLPAKDSKANEDKGTHKASCASSKSTHYLSLTSTGKLFIFVIEWSEIKVFNSN